ncbi:MAG: hypothetical protein ACJ76P_11475 [Actinomycetota bacterium]
MKLRPAVEHLHGSVTDLVEDLRTTAERYAADQDVYHLGHALSEKYQGLADRLAKEIGKEGDDGGPGAVSELGERMRRATSNALAGTDKTGPLLLRDLRALYLEAQETEIDWTIVSQGAKAARERTLIELCTEGMTETEIVVRWLKTRIKETAPQVLVT